MNIMLFKDGKLLLSEAGEPINGELPDGLVMCVTNPQEGQVLTFNGTMWVNADLPEPEETPAEPDGGG